jgi:CMP-N-acetylneuraminic acid synthetase
MKTIAIIPARKGSKRLPDKNIMPLDEIPLIEHSIQYALNNKRIIDAVFVSTNDEKLKEIAFKYGVFVINRPEVLSGDFEPTVSSLKHVLESISNEVENVVLLQPTNPLRPENLLKDSFERFLEEGRDSLFTVSQKHQKLGKIKDNKFIPFNYTFGQRSQDMEPLYYENGLLYISKSELIMKDVIISDNAYPFVVNHVFASVDIDTHEDFDYAEFIIKKYKDLK